MTSRRVRIILATALLPILALLAWWGWNRARDPLAVIGPEAAVVTVVHDSAYGVTTATGEARRYRDLVLRTEGGGDVRVTTSLPADPDRPLPLVLILAGLRTGRESLGVVPQHGNAILVGFEYPYDPADWKRGNPAREALRIRRAILRVPGQVVAAKRHLATSSAVDPSRSALLGYSFGALFVPATQRLAMAHDAAFDAVALAYAGVDLGALIHANLDIEPRWVGALLARTGAAAVHAMEPARHLPELRGRFLVIRGVHDTQIPAPLSARLAALTPEPKDVITLEAGHMGPDAPEVTEQVVRITQAWLEQVGIVAR